MRPYVEALARRDVTAAGVDLPRGSDERAIAAWLEVAPEGSTDIIGGQSYGGRMASLVTARSGAAYAGLVLLSYPLHPPGRPERAAERIAHWPAIDCPVLLLSGEADPFARLPLLREAVGKLRDARLVTYPRAGHGLLAQVEAVADEIARFVEQLGG
jgi:uncharacterized protein